MFLLMGIVILLGNIILLEISIILYNFEKTKRLRNHIKEQTIDFKKFINYMY